MKLKNPSHPGNFIRTEIIAPFGLSVTEAANALGVTRAALSALLNERASLSSVMALRLEKAFGLSMETLMRMQNSFDIAAARQRAGEIVVERFVPKEKEERERSTNTVLMKHMYKIDILSSKMLRINGKS